MDIHSYASDGDYSGVRNELARGVPIDARDEQDYTPLACALSSPNAGEDLVRLLIAAGADVNAAIGESESGLGLAACSRSLSKVQLLLEAGADIRFTSPKGYTVLVNIMYSLHDDDKLVPMAEFLIRSGAELDCETDYGESPLSVASLFGRYDAVRCLLHAGADPSLLRWTELHKAAAWGTCDDVQRPLDGSGGVHERDRWERTPWLVAALAGEVEKAKILHRGGANIEDRGRGGDTALMYCASRGNAEMLRWLIDIGADIEAVDGSGNTALMLAAQAGTAICAELLLKAGSNASHKNEYDENAMAMASTEPIIRMLAGAGEDIADISTEMKRTLTGLHGGESLNVSKAEYQSGRRPRFGRSNPEVMDIRFWREMLRSGISAYQAKVQFGDTDRMEPVWCFSDTLRHFDVKARLVVCCKRKKKADLGESQVG